MFASQNETFTQSIAAINTDLQWQINNIMALFSVARALSSFVVIKNVYEKRMSAFLTTDTLTKGTTYNICALPSDYLPLYDTSFVQVSRNGITGVVTILKSGLVTLTPTTGIMESGDTFQFVHQIYSI